jgi:hypothetical protein
MRLRFGKRVWVATAAFLVALGAAAFAYATVPDGEGVIHGCALKKIGTLRVIDPAIQECTRVEVPIDWNQTGPKGDPGAPGTSVDVIMAGATGTATADGQEVIRQIPLSAGAYTLHATIEGSNANTFAVLLDCRAYSSAGGTGVGFEGVVARGISTLLPDISTSSLDSFGQTIIQGAFQVAADTTISLTCAVDSEHHSVTPSMTTSTSLIIEHVGSITELN